MISLHSQPLAFIKPARNLKAIRYWFSVSTLEKLLTQRRWTHPQDHIQNSNHLNLTNWKPIWGQIQSKTATITNQFNEKHTLSQKKKKQFSKNINQKKTTFWWCQDFSSIILPPFWRGLHHSFPPVSVILCLQTRQRHPESSVVTPWER